ncbi:family 31 glucosidase [Saccharothrix sp. ALI-22-I]|uniref:glycoside hydrolase family 31 protein n=1 Tax=Saccharothrix sp. ALI-22-I TaxID=1933778 RepID=UPI00097C2E8F|nr:TIM-barrel domain-containing protein [Saccharothrix sp. ALI-22-I]ONI91929.1 family 31 glucosidase [Saccharothrix sp. ALI-22-I]
MTEALEWSAPDVVVRVEPWGADSLRVRVARDSLRDDLPGALLIPKPPAGDPVVGERRIVNGAITAELDERGHLRFVDTASGAELLAEAPPYIWWPGPRHFTSEGLEQRFRGYPGERFYGLGQHGHGRLDQKGCVIDLVQRNGEVTIPFLVSSRGYGLLWHNPAIGRVELGMDITRWVARDSHQIDYWITAGDRPADILARYAEATGHTPMMPEWAAGFWQSKLRYKTQDELLAVAREHHGRGLPLSVIVADFFHWPAMGSWRFDPTSWPDPGAMVRELEEMGVRLMVSVWPNVGPGSENYEPMRRAGLLVGRAGGGLTRQHWPDPSGYVETAYVDSTNPAARRYLWEQVERNYLAHGVKVWWLDACEPDLASGLTENTVYHAGPGRAVTNLYPLLHAQGFHEGMRGAGEDEVVLLIRSAWAGSQRYGAAVWSGDVASTFDSLAVQVRAGLNMAMSGIPWWNSDIGGFLGGDPDDEEFRELVIRWFQYAVFTPLLRLHGDRAPNQPFTADMTGGPNELWSFGETAYPILCDQLHLRERLKPYVLDQMRVAHETGLPPMRPLFVDFPDDERAWQVEDQFMFGPDLLVAPVTEYRARSRTVYLPSGTDWTDAWTGTPAAGGTTVDTTAPLDRIPVFVRQGTSPIPNHT